MEEIIMYVLIGIIVTAVVILAIILITYVSKKGQEYKKSIANKVTEKNIRMKEDISKSKEKKDSSISKDQTRTQENVVNKNDIKNVNIDYVENFLEFDEISDNMIIQKNGEKFLMVLKCQGINYDLMSETEMVAVEEGFIEFLNTLRFPIQFYVQTSSLDLTDSIREYNQKIKNQYDDLMQLEVQLKRAEESEEDNDDLVDKLKYEIRKKKNIYEYGKDVISGIERISKNKSILKQNYYIIVPYFTSELGIHSFSKQEVQEMAFSELYTRCNGLISALKLCTVESKIQDSFELAELLYLAYNRDEGEIFSFRNAIEAQYDRLYHTAPDVLDKRIAMLEEEIVQEAANNANKEIIKAAGFLPGDVAENNAMIQKLVYDNQREYVKEYEEMLPEDIIKLALENTKKEYKNGNLDVPSNKKYNSNLKMEKKKEIKDSQLEVEEDNSEDLSLDLGGDDQ